MCGTPQKLYLQSGGDGNTHHDTRPCLLSADHAKPVREPCYTEQQEPKTCPWEGKTGAPPGARNPGVIDVTKVSPTDLPGKSLDPERYRPFRVVKKGETA